MMRTTDDPSGTAPRTWSGTATVVLLVFVAVGALGLNAHDIAVAVIGFVLAVAYVPLRYLRGRVMRARRRQ